VVDRSVLREEYRVPVNGSSSVSLEPPLRDSAPTACDLGSPAKQRPASIIAMKNTRKRMEDRHVVLHDLKAYIPSVLQPKILPEEHVSFYAVFDGHAGTDAATFAAAHLHEMVVESGHYPADPVQAISEACLNCDKKFVETTKKSGTTMVCTLIKDSHIYAAWIGDSHAVLVRGGHCLKIMEPHKPNREDECKRIESLGGAIIHYGTWRVNGQLAVSRAIGDGEYKPLISAQPDVTTIACNGSEDFLVIACDGLWDMVTPEEAAELVYQHIKEEDSNLDGLAHFLAKVAVNRGSADNITIIVVLLKSESDLKNFEGDKPVDITGITSTCTYVSGSDYVDGRQSLEPSTKQSDVSSPGIDFSGEGGGGGIFSPDPFGNAGQNGFDLSKEEFDTRLSNEKEGRFSEESVRISGISELSDEVLKKKSIDKVDDLLAMLDREDCSPNQEEEKSLEEVLAVARERDDEEIDGVDTVDSDSDSDQEVEGSDKLPSMEPQMDPCQQVRVVQVGPEECGTVVPPSLELPSIQEPESVDVSNGTGIMSCSMVKEENGGMESSLTFDDDLEQTCEDFMLKTPGEEESVLVSTKKIVKPANEQNSSASLDIPVMHVTPATPTHERSRSPIDDIASVDEKEDSSMIQTSNDAINESKLSEEFSEIKVVDEEKSKESTSEALDHDETNTVVTGNSIEAKAPILPDILGEVHLGDDSSKIETKFNEIPQPEETLSTGEPNKVDISLPESNVDDEAVLSKGLAQEESDLNEFKMERKETDSKFKVEAEVPLNMPEKKKSPNDKNNKSTSSKGTVASRPKVAPTLTESKSKLSSVATPAKATRPAPTTSRVSATPSRNAGTKAPLKSVTSAVKTDQTSQRTVSKPLSSSNKTTTKPLSSRLKTTTVPVSKTTTENKPSNPASSISASKPLSGSEKSAPSNPKPRVPISSRTPMASTTSKPKTADLSPKPAPRPALGKKTSASTESTTSVKRTTSNASSLRDKKPQLSTTSTTLKSASSSSRLTSTRPSSSKPSTTAATKAEPTPSRVLSAPGKAAPGKPGVSAASRGPMSAPVKPSAAASRVAAAREAAKAAKKKPGEKKKPDASSKAVSHDSPSPVEKDSVKELPESDQNLVLLNQEVNADVEENNPGEIRQFNDESRC